MEIMNEIENDVKQIMKEIANEHDIPEDFYGNSFPNETKFMKSVAQKSATKEAYHFWLNEFRELGIIVAKNYIRAEGVQYFYEHKYVYGVSLRKHLDTWIRNVTLFVKIDDCVKWSKKEENVDEVKHICSFERACVLMDDTEAVEDAEVFKKEI